MQDGVVWCWSKLLVFWAEVRIGLWRPRLFGLERNDARGRAAGSKILQERQHVSMRCAYMHGRWVCLDCQIVFSSSATNRINLV